VETQADTFRTVLPTATLARHSQNKIRMRHLDQAAAMR
jgi:hypothetical protein